MNAEWVCDRARQRELRQPWRNTFGLDGNVEQDQETPTAKCPNDVAYDLLAAVNVSDSDSDDGAVDLNVTTTQTTMM